MRIINKNQLGESGKSKRIYPANLILDKKEKLSTFFKKIRIIPQKRGFQFDRTG